MRIASVQVETDCMDLTPDQAASAVERHDCPKCQAPAGSACRTRAGKTAAKYHTARFILVPALREELQIAVPAGRHSGRVWTRQAAPTLVAQPQGEGGPIRIGYARCSTATQELASQIEALERACCRTIFSEKISNRIKVRPELQRALQLARDIKGAAATSP